MIICSCANINDRKVKNALSSGARTLSDVQAELGVAMGCGSCRDAVQDEISKFYGSAGSTPRAYNGDLAPTA
jgi:bacterioferritin-associated ferredoxin